MRGSSLAIRWKIRAYTKLIVLFKLPSAYRKLTFPLYKLLKNPVPQFKGPSLCISIDLKLLNIIWIPKQIQYSSEMPEVGCSRRATNSYNKIFN